MSVIYIIIILCATLVGAICGMGGGVIIKPLLDASSNFSTFQISLISGSYVLAMSIASLIKHFLNKTQVKVSIAIYLSIGSLCWGLLGDYLFSLVNNSAISFFGSNSQPMIKVVQNSVLLIMLLMVLGYMLFIKPKGIQYHFKSPILILIVVLLLGALSVFLDIGGGPINVCIFVLLFGMDLKLASVNSLITIFFAQITKFVKYGISNSFVTNVVFDANFQIWLFIVLIVVAVVGGLTGAVINKKFSEKFVNIIYCSALGFVVILSIMNIITSAIMLA